MDITSLKGIGEKTAQLFYKLHITTAEELVHYYPRDYEYFTAPVSRKEAGREEPVVIDGRIRGDVGTRYVTRVTFILFLVKFVDRDTNIIFYVNSLSLYLLIS